MTYLSRATRYLHWIIAILVITAFIIGNQMGGLEGEERRFVARMHGSFGMIILVLGTIRLIHRFREGWPEPIGDQPRALHIIASITHHIMLLVPVLLPITGLMIFLSSGGPIYFFTIEIFGGLGSRSSTLREIGGTIHVIGTKIFIGAVILHALGALKHHFIDKDNTLTRMLGFGNR